MVVSLVAATWSLYQLWIASPLPFILNFGIIIDVPARGIHLGFGLLLCFLMFPAARRLAARRMPVYDVVLALVGTGCALYLFLGYDGLVDRQGILLTWDVSLLGAGLVALRLGQVLQLQGLAGLGLHSSPHLHLLPRVSQAAHHLLRLVVVVPEAR